MNQGKQLKMTDVNELFYCLVGFTHFMNNLQNYNLFFEDVLSNPTTFKRFVLCFNHSRRFIRKYPFCPLIQDDLDAFKAFQLLIKYANNYGKKKKD